MHFVDLGKTFFATLLHHTASISFDIGDNAWQEISCFIVITFLLFGWIITTVLYLFLFSTDYYWISLLYTLWYLVDFGSQHTGNHRISYSLRYLSLFRHFAQYFPVNIIRTVDLPEQNNYIFGYHPHGIAAIGSFSAFLTEGAGFSRVFPGLTPCHLLTKVAFYWPVMREVWILLGASTATKENVEKITKTKGNAIVVLAGGAIEALEAGPGRSRCVLKHRKGFIRAALENGCHLVPIFAFGENNVYRQALQNPPKSLARKMQKWIHKWTGFVTVLFYGKGLFGQHYGLIPYRTPINIVVGAPVPVSRVAEPSDQEITDLHRKYRHALMLLFHNYKADFGMDDQELTFV